MPIHKQNAAIRSVDEWHELAPPKSENQWVQHRSAMEVARAWTESGGDTLPSEVSDLFRSHPEFGEVLRWTGEPEAKLPFDAFPGEPRNTDLAVVAYDRNGPYFLAVEAKADEPFAATIAEELASALERKLKNARSNGLARIEQLAAAILGPRKTGDKKVGDLRYQLLTASAGALCEAERQGFTRAVLLVHEFVTPGTADDKHALNGRDLANFLGRLEHAVENAPSTPFLRGPYTVPGAPLLSSPVALYVGKVSRNLRDEV